jgi:hypothetical protein
MNVNCIITPTPMKFIPFGVHLMIVIRFPTSVPLQQEPTTSTSANRQTAEIPIEVLAIFPSDDSDARLPQAIKSGELILGNSSECAKMNQATLVTLMEPLVNDFV